jgi:hypothetical protein
MRHWLWFVVAAVIALGGFAGGLAYALRHLLANDAAMKRIAAPGTSTVDFEKPGLYTIYVERIGKADIPKGLKVGVAGTGWPVALVTSNVSSSYSIGNRSGVSFRTITIDQPGAYRVTVDALPEGHVLAIAEGTGWSDVRLIFAAMAIAFAGFAVAGIIVLVTLLQRSKASKIATTNP